MSVVKIFGGGIVKFGKNKLKKKVKDTIFKEVQSFYAFGFEDCKKGCSKKSVDELKAIYEDNIKKREKQ